MITMNNLRRTVQRQQWQHWQQLCWLVGITLLCLHAPPLAAQQGDDIPTMLYHATWSPGCAPWDGLSQVLTLAESEEKEYPHVRVSFWRVFPKVSEQTQTFEFDLKGDDGYVSYCLSESNCVIPKSHQVEFFKFSPEGPQEGRIMLLMPDNRRFVYPFWAESVTPDPPILCG